MKFKPSLMLLAAISIPAIASEQVTAPVSGFARSFILGTELSHATLTILETGEKIQTDSHGKFGPFQYPVAKELTLRFEKFNYKTTQSGTYVVPKEGLTGPYNNITFQIPSIESYYILKSIVGGVENANSCHVTTTVTAYHKTLDDIPQGEENADIVLIPSTDEKPFYFDIFKSGPLKGKTNPFTKTLTKTSEDGGVAFFNLPASEKPYILTAKKDGVRFTEARFKCIKGAFINVSPPGGPMALQ